MLPIKIQYHAEQIASIGFSDIPNAAFVQATQPIYYGNSALLQPLFNVGKWLTKDSREAYQSSRKESQTLGFTGENRNKSRLPYKQSS